MRVEGTIIVVIDNIYRRNIYISYYCNMAEQYIWDAPWNELSMMAYPSFLDYCQCKTVAKKLNLNNIGVDIVSIQVSSCFCFGRLLCKIDVLHYSI